MEENMFSLRTESVELVASQISVVAWSPDHALSVGENAVKLALSKGADGAEAFLPGIRSLLNAVQSGRLRDRQSNALVNHLITCPFTNSIAASARKISSC